MNNKEEILDVNIENKNTAPVYKPAMDDLGPVDAESSKIQQAAPVYKPAMDDLGPVDAESSKIQQVAPVYKPAMDDLGPVDAEAKKVVATPNNATFAPKIESLTPALDEATAIKETQAAQPNKIDDPSLKVEDEIKSSSRKLPPMTPEENAKDSKKKKMWLFALLIILGLAVMILPWIFKII